MAEDDAVVGSDELVVTVEMGDDFVPGERTAAALSELVDALNEEHGDDDVGGFSFEKPEVRSFSFGFSPQPERNFMEGWPAKWKMNEFDGKNND